MSTNWGLNYAWGLPVIVLTVIIHAYGLGLINKFFSSTLVGAVPLRNLRVPSTFFVGRAVLLVTILHGLECAIWAGAYRFLGALQDNKSAMLYSLNAMTSYGHENLNLAPSWQMMGALESLDGWILFGLTTAFLFTIIQSVWLHHEPNSSISR
jgi:hypothetical protein